jgi:hypothetical protein
MSDKTVNIEPLSGKPEVMVIDSVSTTAKNLFPVRVANLKSIDVWLKPNMCIGVKLIRYQFRCARCAFRLLKSHQWYLGRKSWKSEQNCENRIRAEKTKYCVMKLSQIRRRIGL